MCLGRVGTRALLSFHSVIPLGSLMNSGAVLEASLVVCMPQTTSHFETPVLSCSREGKEHLPAVSPFLLTATHSTEGDFRGQGMQTELASYFSWDRRCGDNGPLTEHAIKKMS